MADENRSASKTARKNKKRSEKRLQAKVDLRKTHMAEAVKLKDPVEILRDKLQEAKDNKDHALAAKLRQQLWVEQDKAAGLKPNHEDEAGYSDITGENPVTNPTSPSSPGDQDHAGSLTPTEKKLRALNKKLQQIQTLKERQAKGEQLEQTQITKIDSEQALLREVNEMRALIGKVTL